MCVDILQDLSHHIINGTEVLIINTSIINSSAEFQILILNIYKIIIAVTEQDWSPCVCMCVCVCLCAYVYACVCVCFKMGKEKGVLLDWCSDPCFYFETHMLYDRLSYIFQNKRHTQVIPEVRLKICFCITCTWRCYACRLLPDILIPLVLHHRLVQTCSWLINSFVSVRSWSVCLNVWMFI